MAEKDEELERLKAENEQYKEHQAKEALRNQELQDKIGADDLIGDEIKNLAKPVDAPAPQAQASLKVLDPKFDLQQRRINGDELEFKMVEADPDKAHIKAQKLAYHIQNGKLPYDIVRLANEHSNGADFIGNMLEDENILNSVRLASYECTDISSFSLKFNELADKVNVSSEKEVKKPVQKVKPTPNEPIKQTSASVDKDDSDTVYLD